MKKLAAYCRVSTDRQKEEKTVESQKMEIKDWAQLNDAVIVDWYVDDGWSGDMLARPELDRLRDDASKNIWQGVIWTDRDRLARRYSYQELVIEELQEKGIETHFIHQAKAETPEDKILQGFQGLFAEYERVKIAERMRRGKIHKAKSGNLVGYQASYGYRYIPKQGDKEGQFVIYEPEAEIVKMIFHWVADDQYSMRRIIKELYDRKIPPPKGKSEAWRKSTLERMLKRKDYIGIHYYNKTISVVPKNPHNVGRYKKIKKSSRRMKAQEEWIAIPVPPLIDEDLFDRARQQIKDNLVYNNRNKKYDYLLSGKVYCLCGIKRVGDGVNNHHYYRCAQRIYKYPLPNRCTYDGINAEILDTAVWNKIHTLLANPDLIKAQVQKWLSKHNKMTSKSQKEALQLKSALNVLSEEEKRYVKAYGANLLSFEKFKELLNDVKIKRTTLESQLNNLTDQVDEDEVSLGSLDQACDMIIHTLKYATTSDKKNYLRKLITQVIVGERNLAVVKGHIPLKVQENNIQYATINRNSQDVNPQSMPFTLRIKLPPLRKYRHILERNKLGRITRARSPQVRIKQVQI